MREKHSFDRQTFDRENLIKFPSQNSAHSRSAVSKNSVRSCWGLPIALLSLGSLLFLVLGMGYLALPEKTSKASFREVSEKRNSLKKPELQKLKAKIRATKKSKAETLNKSSSESSFLDVKFKNWGLFSNTKKNHIFAPKAWSFQKGKKDVVVAVIDTGIDKNHPDLKSSLWKSPGNPKSFGWDFVTDKPTPMDEHGHGSHVSGIIGANFNKEKGVAGVAPGVTLMSLRYYSAMASGSVNLQNTIKAVKWAIDNGADIINYSGGGPVFSKEEYEALKLAAEKDVLIVAAAGNNGDDLDRKVDAYYPASYPLENIIAVAATDEQNNLHGSSNYGLKTVDVAAPGTDIYSTLHKNSYAYMTGTSQATAFVSGVAALLLSENPNLKPKEIKEILVSSSDSQKSLQGKLASGGKINAFRALLTLQNQKTASNKSDQVADAFLFPTTLSGKRLPAKQKQK
jgi:subtilisin family serine protease